MRCCATVLWSACVTLLAVVVKAGPMPGRSSCDSGHSSGFGHGCRKCPLGTYYGHSGTKNQACYPCPAGTASNTEGATACETCAPGKYARDFGLQIHYGGHVRRSAGATACLDCPVGTYGANYAGATTCTTCPSGKATISNATTSAVFCETCSPGKYENISGYYDALYSDGASASIWYFGAVHHAPIHDFSVTFQKECSACPTGTYSTSNGETACTACAAGQASTVIGGVSVSSCKACARGRYSMGT